MCTTVLDVDFASPVPVLLIGVRDEFLDRPWVGPGRHWPRWPDLIGGQDLQAGGTWLAVNPDAPRVACVLNGRGASAAEDVRLSRGILPLRLAAGEIGDAASKGLDALDLDRYDPFHLLLATPDAACLWSWDGERLLEQNLAAGLHLIVNSGLEGGVRGGEVDVSPEAEHMRARVDYFRPLLDAAHRPEPSSASSTASAPAPATTSAWGDWLSVADGAGLDPTDPRALLVRGGHLGRDWGSSSVSLVALTRTGARYDFRATSGQGQAEWTTVLPEAP